jgi:hypothetical protein
MNLGFPQLLVTKCRLPYPSVLNIWLCQPFIQCAVCLQTFTAGVQKLAAIFAASVCRAGHKICKPGLYISGSQFGSQFKNLLLPNLVPIQIDTDH